MTAYHVERTKGGAGLLILEVAADFVTLEDIIFILII
jgi:hypothetical protein